MTELPDVRVDPLDLQRLVPFQDCTLEELGRAAALCRPVSVGADTQLLVEGAQGHGVIVVRTGEVRVRNGADLDAALGPGDVLGELSAMAGEPVSADVVTTEPSELLVIAAEDVPALLAIPPVGRRLRAIARARIVAGGRSAVEATAVPMVRQAPRVRGPGAGMYSKNQLPNRLVRVSILLLLLAGAGAGAAWFGNARNRTTAVSLEEALAAVRNPAPTVPAVSTTDLPGSDPSPTTTMSRREVTSESSPGALPEPTPIPQVPAARRAAPAVAKPDAVATSAAQTAGTRDSTSAATATTTRFHPPAAGVYSYATTGSERIDLGGAHHDYPAETHAIVRTDDTCGWSVEHEVIKEHVDRHERCSDTDAVFVLADGRDVEFYGQRESVTYRCPRTTRLLWDATPGTTSTGGCATPDGRSRFDYEGVFVGAESVSVENQAVDVVHLHIEFTMTGDVRGTSTTDFWLAAESGLIVREERTVDTHAKSALGDVHYQERAAFRLESLTPRR